MSKFIEKMVAEVTKHEEVEKLYIEEAAKTDWLVDIKIESTVVYERANTVVHVMTIEFEAATSDIIQEFFSDEGLRRCEVVSLDAHHAVVILVSYI